MNLGLDGRVVLVTGGSSGIGLATVERLVDEGARVATCGRDADRLQAAMAPFAASGRVLSAPCDILEPEAVEELVARTVSMFGRLDGLVNNAGQGRVGTFESTTAEDWRSELELKFFGLINPTNAALPHLRRSDAPRIVNINAVVARQPESHLVATSAARAGALNLSRSLATELAPQVLVNTVALGLIDSEQWRRRYAASNSPLSWEEWAGELAESKHIPLGRLGRADEVAALVTFLVSPAASYITGATIDVAGGVARYV